MLCVITITLDIILILTIHKNVPLAKCREYTKHKVINLHLDCHLIVPAKCLGHIIITMHYSRALKM